jgi:tetratricopeptide (TPR) repeat protein
VATATVSDDPDAALAAIRDLVAAEPALAATTLTAIVDRFPDHLPALRLLARALRKMGQPEIAAQLDLRSIAVAGQRPALVTAIRHFAAGRLQRAETIARRTLATDPEDVAALCLLAEIARRANLPDEAEQLLRRALTVAPDFAEARVSLAKLLAQRGDARGALALLDAVLDAAPDDAGALAARLAIVAQSGDYTQAIACYEGALAHRAHDARLWTDYGYGLRTAGRREESARAFRAALAIDPGVGEAWLGLGQVGRPPLDRGDVAAMESALADTTDAKRSIPLHFALGRALEGLGSYEASFRHYTAGNRIQRKTLRYDAEVISDEVRRSTAFFTADRLHALGRSGVDGSAPIFVIGMPRSGSSLVEQILASHHAVEGLSEQPDLPRLVLRLIGECKSDGVGFPEVLAGLSAADFRALGQAYLQSIATRKRTRRPFFVDKLPNNWAFVGLIPLILPDAVIIDVRRDPVACGFSNFAQYFPRGQGFSNDLADFARYYRDYTTLIEHFGKMLPGRIQHVDYETLVADPASVIRHLLAGIGLPFDPACLRFHENPRPVPTPSAEQVRRPINRSGIERAVPYASWLGELTLRDRDSSL